MPPKKKKNEKKRKKIGEIYMKSFILCKKRN